MNVQNTNNMPILGDRLISNTSKITHAGTYEQKNSRHAEHVGKGLCLLTHR